MTIDARIPLMVQPVKSELDRQNSLADLMAQQQTMDMRRQQFEAKQAEQQEAKQREQMGVTARLLDGVTDENTYQQRIGMARQYGIDVNGAPPSFDPNWVQTHRVLAKALSTPEGKKELSTTAQELAEAGYQPGTPAFQQAMAQRIEMKDSRIVSTTDGGMAGLVGPGGAYKPLILPNPGGAQPGAPVAAGGPQPGAVVGGFRFKGGNPNDRNAWEPAGGTGSNAGGGFPARQ